MLHDLIAELKVKEKKACLNLVQLFLKPPGLCHSLSEARSSVEFRDRRILPLQILIYLQGELQQIQQLNHCTIELLAGANLLAFGTHLQSEVQLLGCALHTQPTSI